MSKLQAVKALVAERLAAAAEEILGAVEKMLLHTSDMPPEQQRAAVHKRLAVVAEEISRILEMMMGKYADAEDSCSHKEFEHQHLLLDSTLKMEAGVQQADKLPISGSDCEKDVSSEHRRSSSQLQKTPNPPQIKDASTETDCRPSHLRQIHRAEKGTSTMMETELLSPSDKVLSSDNSGVASEDNEINEKPLKSMKKTFQIQSQGEDCCKMCGRSFHKSVTGKNKTNRENISITNKSQTTGQSCCRVCGKLFRYKRSFLKHVLTHGQSSGVCGACGKLLDSDESLKTHLQTHSEDVFREQTDDKRSEAEGSDADSKVGDSDEEWKDSEASDSDDGDSEKDETKDRRCLQKSKTK
ncbi:hypothetical protein FQN60_002867, partial [Etheostoma spectabile]